MKKYFLLLGLFIFTVGCDEDTMIDDLTNADREVMLRSLGENVIVPGFAKLNSDVEALRAAILDFTSTPTQAKIIAAQDAWVAAVKTWKRVEVFQQGILDIESASALIYRIDLGSADFTKRTVPVDSVALATAMAGLQGDAQQYVGSKPASMQGFSVIEYLLFNGGAEAALTRASSETTRGYLEGLAKALAAKTAQLATEWSPSGGNYLKTFSENYGSDIGSSLGMLVNDMVLITEVIKNQKLLMSMDSGADLVEARPSERSLELIVENINGLESAFTADADGRSGKGIDELLRSIDAKVGDDVDLVDAVMTQFDRIREVAGEINAPLHVAVTTIELDKVRDLLFQMQTLIRLFKADMMVALGVMLTGFEGDGD